MKKDKGVSSMKNKIDKIITLVDNSKYMVLDQGNYDNKYYYLVSKLDENDDLTNKLSIIEENNNMVETVKDEKLLEALVDYFKKRFEVVA